MIKNIKYFLLTSVSLGFLQLESSAMEEADNNTATIRHTAVQERRETDDRLHNELTRIRENATGFSISIEAALSSMLTRFQQQSEDIRALIQENRDLRTTVSALQEKLNPSRPLKAMFGNPTTDWAPYTNANWEPVTFNWFEGDERLRGNQSIIEIPEDGMYSLLAHYYWRANGNGNTAPYTSITINTPTNMNGCYAQHHIDAHHIANGMLNRVTRLNRGEKVMVSIQGHQNAEYNLCGFRFEIEKIH